ncbi:MAG: hypothetical protein KC478_10355 [Bacteriovoracaceae bacterium]|nr:hypothetical protein [Bacteriovoracaceae bacterium]
MKTYLCNFKQYTPPVKTTQEESIEWLKSYHARYQSKNPYLDTKRVSKFLDRFSVASKDIESRMSFVPGLGSKDWRSGFFNQDRLNPTLSERSELAQGIFEKIFTDLYSDSTLHPEHLLHVSCTHYQSPSAAQILVSNKNWNTAITHLYHMGCYASLPAIRTAKAHVSDGAQMVDIVHTETCSLHLNPSKFTPEQIVVQSLFSDGAIKYSCLGENEFTASELSGFEILAQAEMLIPDTSQEMTWKTGAHRFDMSLSKKAPSILSENVEAFCKILYEKAGLEFKKDKNNCTFAIHPGGPKIVDSVSTALGLSQDQVAQSKEILLKRGNMSSATLPHIWQSILESSDDKYIATLGFGPGLTLIGAIFKTCKISG